MSDKVIPILTAPAKANVCRTLNQKGRITGFHALWYAQEMTQAATTSFSLYFVILEFLQWVNSIYHIFFLTWAPLFQYLVCLQKRTTHFLQLKVTFVKKSIYMLRSCVHNKGWSQEEEKFNWGLKLAKVWSICLRNYIIEHSLALQRKICNAGHSYTCGHSTEMWHEGERCNWALGVGLEQGQTTASSTVPFPTHINPGLHSAEGLPAVASCQFILLNWIILQLTFFSCQK